MRPGLGILRQDYLLANEFRIKALRGEVHETYQVPKSKLEVTIGLFKRHDPHFACLAGLKRLSKPM